jgi:hypothetical protein
MQFFRRHFGEELQLSHTSFGSPLFVVLLNQPLLNLKSANTSILVYNFYIRKIHRDIGFLFIVRIFPK